MKTRPTFHTSARIIIQSSSPEEIEEALWTAYRSGYGRGYRDGRLGFAFSPEHETPQKEILTEKPLCN